MSVKKIGVLYHDSLIKPFTHLCCNIISYDELGLTIVNPEHKQVSRFFLKTTL